MILVVDDKKENLLSLQSLLILHGYSVETAESGEEALKKVLRSNYALIILDVQMPGMDGFEVAEMISGYSKTDDIPIIFLSAVSTDKKFITKGYSSGAVDYITKPIDPDIFLLKVSTLYKIYEQKRELKEIQAKLHEEIEYRRRAQQESLEKAQQLVSVLESIPQIAFTMNVDGTLEYFNSKWDDYTDLKNEFPETHPDDPNLQTLIEGMLNEGAPLDREIRIKKPGTEFYRYFLLRVVPVRKLGKIERWVGTFTDIDDQKQVSQKKDEFISVASHELKTPLTSIKGYVQLLERTLETGSSDHLYVERTLYQVKKLDKLINDLLDISKIEGGKLRLNMGNFELDKLLATCVDIMRQTFPEYDFVYEEKIDAIVCGDEERLEQVVLNFLSNAVKYSPVNKKVILRTLINQEGLAEVRIQDFGIGISSEDLPKVFEKFFRAGESSQRFPGLGLGLYISADILERHGAIFGVNSEAGKGTTFYFSLPFNN